MRNMRWTNGKRLLAALALVGVMSGNALAFRLGDEGTEVAAVQQALVDLGYDVAPDGDYGPGTAAAVREYQKQQGMQVDGIVGQDVYRALLGRELPKTSRASEATGINRRIIALAMQQLGVPYVYGGATPSGFDCSGFVSYVFAHAGISLPRTADDQYLVGRPISKSALRAGDLVFFSADGEEVSHVGIYLQDSQFIHASTTYGIAFDSLTRDYRVEHYVGARRVTGE